MLKNLIASCLIASSVNLQPLTPNKAIQNTYNEDIEILNDIYITGTSRIKVRKTEGQISTDYIRVNMVSYEINMDDFNSEYYVANIQTPNTLKAINYCDERPTDHNYNVPVAQRLTILKIDANNINTDVELQLNLNRVMQQTFNAYTYIESIQTNRDLSNLMNLNPVELTILGGNKTPYTYYAQVKNGLYSYNSYITTKKDTYIYRLGAQILVRNATTIDLNLLNNKTNYVAIFTQPQYYIENETNNWTIQNSAIYSTDFSSLGTISGTNIISDANTEVIDVPSVMFDVVGMPFTFMSTAFNLTMFAGTPYQINISNLVLTLFALLTFIFILKLFLKMKG